MNYPLIIRFPGKHADSYYYAEDKAAADKIHYDYLKTHFEYGEYEWMSNYKPIGTPPDYTEADIVSMPKSLQLEATQNLRRWNKVAEESKQLPRNYLEIKRVIEDKDYAAASNILWEIEEGPEVIYPINYQMS